MIHRFMEYRASCVRIPERIGGIPIFVWKIPVTSPAAMPARTAHRRATQRFVPFIMSITHTAPPVAIVPSTVRSEKSRTLYVRYTPMAIMPQIRPCAVAPGSALIKDDIFKFLSS